MNGKYVNRAATMTTDASVANGYIDVDADVAVVSVEDLSYVSLYLNQVEDAGNASILVEKSADGINWATVGTYTQADFPAGNNTSKEIPLSDANGMPLVTKQIRATLSGHSSTGKYTLTAAGLQRPGYAG